MRSRETDTVRGTALSPAEPATAQTAPVAPTLYRLPERDLAIAQAQGRALRRRRPE